MPTTANDDDAVDSMPSAPSSSTPDRVSQWLTTFGAPYKRQVDDWAKRLAELTGTDEHDLRSVTDKLATDIARLAMRVPRRKELNKYQQSIQDDIEKSYEAIAEQTDAISTAYQGGDDESVDAAVETLGQNMAALHGAGRAYGKHTLRPLEKYTESLLDRYHELREATADELSRLLPNASLLPEISEAHASATKGQKGEENYWMAQTRLLAKQDAHCFRVDPQNALSIEELQGQRAHGHLTQGWQRYGDHFRSLQQEPSIADPDSGNSELRENLERLAEYTVEMPRWAYETYERRMGRRASTGEPS